MSLSFMCAVMLGGLWVGGFGVFLHGFGRLFVLLSWLVIAGVLIVIVVVIWLFVVRWFSCLDWQIVFFV